MRFRPVLILPALLLLPLALSTGYAEPRATWNLAARVPASCLAFVGIEDVDQLEARSKQTAFGRLIDDPAMQPFMAPLIKAGKEFTTLPAEVPQVVRDLLKLTQSLRGQAALAFVGMDMDNGEPSIVASIDFGGRTTEFATLLQRAIAELGEGKIQVAVSTKDGRPWWTITIKHGPALVATLVDTTFVVATGAPLLSSVIGAPATAGTLATSPGYQGVLQKIGRDGLVLLAYANTEAMLASFGRQWQGPERRMADAFGLDTLKAVAYGMSYAGDGFRDTLLIHAPGADHGLIPMFQLAPMDPPKLLGMVPGNALAYAEANVGLDNMLGAFRKIAGMVDDEAAAEMDKGLAELGAQLGVNVEKDVLGGLAGTIGWYASLPQGGGLYPEVAAMATVKDPAAYEGVLQKLCEGLAGMANEQGHVIVGHRVMQYEGQNLHLVELQMARGDDPIPFTPAWTLLGDKLVVTLVPYTLKEIVWRAKHGADAGPGLDQQEDFKALLALKPASAGSVSYIDLQALLAVLYDTGVPLLQTLVKPNMLAKAGINLPLDWAALPPARVVRPYLRSMMCFESWGPDGIEMRMHAPIPLVAAVVSMAAVAACVAIPMRRQGMVRSARAAEVPMEDVPAAPADERSLAQLDLRSLTSYVNMYLLEEQSLPASLDDLVKKSFLEQLPRDPWGRAYRLVVTDAKARTFQVVSDGPDGKPSTADDVSLVAPGGR